MAEIGRLSRDEFRWLDCGSRTYRDDAVDKDSSSVRRSIDDFTTAFAGVTTGPGRPALGDNVGPFQKAVDACLVLVVDGPAYSADVLDDLRRAFGPY